MELEDLIKFLGDNGVEVPEGAAVQDVINILEALLPSGEKDDSDKKENIEKEDEDQNQEDIENGVA